MVSSPLKRRTSALDRDDEGYAHAGPSNEHRHGPSPKKRSRYLSTTTPPQTPSSSRSKAKYDHIFAVPHTHQGIPSRTLNTPSHSFPLGPSDSPTNPFGRTRRLRLTKMLPPPTKFAHHSPLRLQLVRSHGLSPYMGGVYRIVQVPLNYTFVHLRCLILWVFSRPSEISRTQKRRRRRMNDVDLQEDEGYWFEVRKGAKAYSMKYKPGQVRGGTTTVKSSKVRDPCRFRPEKDGFVALEDEDEDFGAEISAGSGSDDEENPFEVKRRSDDVDLPAPDEVFDEGTSLVKIDVAHLEEIDDEEDVDERDEDDADWRWEPEDEFTLANAWATGPNVDRVIIYHHDETTQVHITLNTLPIERRRGTSNTPYVFQARGRVSLCPPAEAYESGWETSDSEYGIDMYPPSSPEPRNHTKSDLQGQRATQSLQKEGSDRLAWLYRNKADLKFQRSSSPTPSNHRLEDATAPAILALEHLESKGTSQRAEYGVKTRAKTRAELDDEPDPEMEQEEEDDTAQYHEGEELASVVLPVSRWNDNPGLFESFVERYNKEEEREARRERRRKRKSLSRSSRSSSVGGSEPKASLDSQDLGEDEDSQPHSRLEAHAPQHSSSSSRSAHIGEDIHQIPCPSEPESPPRKSSRPQSSYSLKRGRGDLSSSRSPRKPYDRIRPTPVFPNAEASSSKESIPRPIFPSKSDWTSKLPQDAPKRSYSYHSSRTPKSSVSTSPISHFDHLPPNTSPATSPERVKTLNTPAQDRELLSLASHSEPRAFPSTQPCTYLSSQTSSYSYRDAYSSPIRGRTASNATTSSSLLDNLPHRGVVELTMRMVNDFKFTPAPAKAVRRKIERIKRRLIKLSHRVKEEGRKKRKGKKQSDDEDDDGESGSSDSRDEEEDGEDQLDEVEVKVEEEVEDYNQNLAKKVKVNGKQKVEVKLEPVEDPVLYQTRRKRQGLRSRHAAVDHDAGVGSQVDEGERPNARRAQQWPFTRQAQKDSRQQRTSETIRAAPRRAKGKVVDVHPDDADDIEEWESSSDQRGLKDLRKFGIISEPDHYLQLLRDRIQAESELEQDEQDDEQDDEDDEEEQEVIDAVQDSEEIDPASEVGECSLGQVLGAERARMRRQFGTRKGRTSKQSMYPVD